MDGLPSSVKESVGEYTSSKDLWFKLDSDYQKARREPEKTDQESEDKPPEELNQEEEKQEEDSSKGMDSCDYNDLRANWFLSTVNLNQSDFMMFKKKILDSLNEYQ